MNPRDKWRCLINTVTSGSSLAQLFVLNEARKHLSVHEELQELTDSAGGVRFAEAVSLDLSAPVGGLDHVEGIVAHQLHEEAHKPLRHQSAQVHLLIWTGHIVDEDKTIINRLSSRCTVVLQSDVYKKKVLQDPKHV